MPAPRKYPQELRERAVRLVGEARVEEPELSVTAAVNRDEGGCEPGHVAWLGEAVRY